MRLDPEVTPAMIAHETERLLDTAAAFANDAILAPSLCEGWSRGHVLTHVARNADGMARVCRAILDDTGETMYAGDDVRDEEIAAGCRRRAADLAADVRESAAALAPLLARLGPDHVGASAERTPGGRRVAAEDVLFLRLRELVFHHVDLHAGFTFAHVAPELQKLLLDHEVERVSGSAKPPSVTIHTREGEVYTIGEGTAHVSGSRAGVLAWLGRQQGEGVEAQGELPEIPTGA
ncbi:MAG TPA: maleylpyruvate isomerase family mycothiol-dependent enzyme [Dermatophilaceae bacterium]|nr:maleylpyruvate isomerase family mycothiol-dependent enzyme [Dermatophilaceae bacterium]